MGLFLWKKPPRPLNMLIFNLKKISKYNISIESPNISIFVIPLTFLVWKKVTKSHCYQRYTLFTKIGTCRVNNTWFQTWIKEFPSFWVMSACLYRFISLLKLSFKIPDHFQQCSWIFGLVTFLKLLKKLLVWKSSRIAENGPKFWNLILEVI